ncbi:MAG: hypothetical protein ACLP8A_00375 [Methylovirgula sp.]
MMRSRKASSAVLWLGLVLAIAVPVAHAETAKSVDQIPSKLKTPEAKKVFEEQMEGKPAPDKLGLHLPAGLAAKDIAALLLPAGDKDPLNSVGAKPLPDQPDLYAAIVCTGGDVPTRPDDIQCGQFMSDTKPALAGLSRRDRDEARHRAEARR